MATAKTEVSVEPGKVNEVRNQLLLQGDEGLAQRLQDEEFGEKYKWNRAERQVARKDVPLAKVVHTEEEERLQKERYERLQLEKMRADEDARIAQQLEREDQLRRDLERLQEDDVRLAKEMQQEELKHVKMAEEDAKIAMQLQKQELVHRRSERRQREMEDQSLAQRLQERERRLTALIAAEHELRRQQRPQALDAGRVQNTWLDDRNGPSQNVLVARGAMVFDEDDEDSPDVDREELLCRQDREMAKALQELELEQSRATHHAADEQMYDIVGSDARLARIMQEQERLDALRRAEERRIRRTAREYHARQAALQHAYNSVQPPQYDPPPVPRYVESRQQACPRHACSCGHADNNMQHVRHHQSDHDPRYDCGPPQYACEHPGRDMYRGPTVSDPHYHQERSSQHPAVRTSRSTGESSSAFPSDFLRLEGNDVSRQQRAGYEQQRGTGPGPVYIGPAGRSASVREQRTDNPQDVGVLDPKAKHVNRSKSGNCKQQ